MLDQHKKTPIFDMDENWSEYEVDNDHLND